MNLIIRFAFAIFVLTSVIACGGGKPEELTTIDGELYLDNLVIEGYDINFDPAKTGTYELELEDEVETLNVRYSGTQADATLVVQKNSSRGVITQQEDNDGKIPLSIDEGENYFRLVFLSSDEQQSITYLIRIYRPTRSAQLQSLNLYNLEDSSFISLSPTFRSGHYQYSANIGYSTCSLALDARGIHAATQIKVAGQELDEGEVAFHRVAPGRSYLDIELSSELGIQEVYSLELNRAEPTDSQMESNARLSNLSLESIDFDFYCGISEYFVNVDHGQQELALSFEAEVEGAKIYVNGDEVAADEVHRLDFMADSRVISVLVQSLDGTQSRSYSITAYRSASNRVEVSTVEEILTALANASPRDEIVVASGEYVFSADQLPIRIEQSGATGERIVLRSDNADEPSVLIAAEDPNNIISLAADHWRIQSLVLRGAQTQIDVAQSNNVELNDLRFEQYARTAIRVNGEGIDLDIRDSEFAAPEDDLGQHIQVVQAGAFDHLRLHHNVLHSEGHNSLTLAGSANHDIRFNRFYRHSGEASAQSLISAEANFELAYNQIIASGGASGDALIQVGADAQARMFQNRFELSEFMGTLFSNEGLGQVEINANSIEHDQSDYTLASGAVAQASIQPVYRIALAGDATRCLGLETQEVTEYDETFDRHFVVISPCDDDHRTRWQWKADDGVHVTIENMAVQDQILTTHQSYYSLCEIEQGRYNNAAYLQASFGGWLQRWKLDIRDDELLFRNRMVPEFGLTVAGGNAPMGRWLSTCALAPTEYQRFQLIEVD